MNPTQLTLPVPEPVRGFTVRSTPLLCLSVRQPWAWLIVNGWKNIENRDWPTKVRGRVLIHAGKTMTRSDWFACTLFMRGFNAFDLIDMLPGPEQLERGGIGGAAVILDCVRTHSSEWFCGPYGFVLDEQKALPFQEFKGRLGFWRLP